MRERTGYVPENVRSAICRRQHQWEWWCRWL